MVQAKKFEQSFINEYLAWTLHDHDVEMRGRKEGREAGLKEQASATALNMLADGLPLEKIAQYTGLSAEDIQSLKPTAIVAP